MPGIMLPGTTREGVVSSMLTQNLTCLRPVMLSQEGASQRTWKVGLEGLAVVVDTAKSGCGRSSPPRYRRRSY